MVFGYDRSRYNKLKEEYETLRQSFLATQDGFIHLRRGFLMRQSDKLKTYNSLIRIHATVIRDRYEGHDDLNFCSSRILEHAEKIESVIEELRQAEPN